MHRLFWIVGLLAATGAVVAAGRYWAPPPVEDWTAAPAPEWRGLDGAGYTLACPTDFRHDQEDTRPGEQEIVLRPPESQAAALHVFALSEDAPRRTLRQFLRERLGLRTPGRACSVRLGPLAGPGEAGTLASGSAWKATALNAAALPGRRHLQTLIVTYEQVPPAQRPLFDRMLGSVRVVGER